MIEKLLVAYSFFTVIFLSVNLFVPEGIFLSPTTSLLSLVLIPWWLAFLYILISRYDFLPRYYLYGSLTIFIFILIAILFSRREDLLALSYSATFLAMSFLYDIWKPSTKLASYTFSFFDYFFIAITIFSIGQAFFLFDNPFVNIFYLEEQLKYHSILRFSITQDYVLLSFLFVWFLYRVHFINNGIKKITMLVLLIPIILRVYASGSRGILTGTLLSGISFLFLTASVNKKSFIMVLLVTLVISSAFWFYSSDTMKFLFSEYSFALTRGSETAEARIAEAWNDWGTFKEYPIWGSGFHKASEKVNSMGEPSYGHFFLTGTLARFGVIGFFGFLITYYTYFKYQFTLHQSRLERARKNSLFILISFFLVFGNPLYLLIIWPMFPLFFNNQK